MNKKRVAIIGAGFGGLTAIKACLEEGLEPVCFEQDTDIGGIWHYTDEVRPHQGASIYTSVITNISKEIMCFSDFPYPREHPPYFPWHVLTQYLHDYADRFNLRRHVRLGTKVLKVEPADGFARNGRWKVQTISVDPAHSDAAVHEDVFDAVMLCNGPHGKPFIPTVPGLDQFQGIKAHSNSHSPQAYNGPHGKPFIPNMHGLDKFQGIKAHSNSHRCSEVYRKKTVLVVGGGNSAGDVACDLATIASQVYLSMKPGTAIVPRLGPQAVPNDLSFRRAIIYTAPDFLRRKFNRFSTELYLNKSYYGIPSTDQPGRTSVIINDQIILRLATGQVIAKPEVEEFTRTGVVFTDKSVVRDLDAVIFATGYTPEFSFMDESILSCGSESLDLYKAVFPAQLPHPTLAVIGMVKAGALSSIPVREIQARWAARVFKGLAVLPGTEAMLSHLNEQSTSGHRIPTADLRYCDDIANEIGALPGFWRLLVRDPKLAFLYYFGPAFPVHYRLVGPHSWKQATAYAKEAYLNTFYGTSGCKVASADNNYSFKTILGVFGLSTMIVLTAMYM